MNLEIKLFTNRKKVIMEMIYKYEDIDSNKVKEVGGKNASLGEMISKLKEKDILVPDGFATTSVCYWEFIEKNKIKGKISKLLSELDIEKHDQLEETGQVIRKTIMESKIPDEIKDSISRAYTELKERDETLEGMAVRSSATAEDLPDASFAGQHDTFLNVEGEEELFEAWKKCVASLFTDRAIKYREENGFDHMKVALSVGVQKMVRSDRASSGVAFTIDPDSGFDKVILVNGAWGLGENVVQGTIMTDEFYLFKKALREDKVAIINKNIGNKKKMMVYSGNGDKKEKTKNIDTPEEKRKKPVLNDKELTKLGKWCLEIEDHYKKPMDIEWAVDGDSDELFIVQARPETVHSAKEEKSKFVKYNIETKDYEPIISAIGIGNKIASGKVKILDSPDEAGKIKKGDVLVTEITNPDWDPIMKKASAIITNSGGRTSHAAIVARELGAVAVVGSGNATEILKDEQEVTVTTAKGNNGFVYDGHLEWDEEEIDLEKLGNPETKVMMILANPLSAFNNAMYPVDGVGLLRLEFAINSAIKVHPMALVKFDEIDDEAVKKEIIELTTAYQDKKKYFTEKLSWAVATIAAAFYPRTVIVRMSDFKTNEYSDLIGGKQFEPQEENPMVGFRGASRYYNERYKEGFKLECEAMRSVRNKMGLKNVKLMIPFCRTVEEGKRVIDVMAEYGLKQGENGLEVYMMTEIPGNVLMIDDYAGIFDGFSIGSNDLTQLTLGIDRDSEIISELFDERNPGVKKLIADSISSAKKSKREIGLCGQAPSDFPDFAQFLVENKINSISFNPDAIAKGIENIMKAEKKIKK